MRNKMLRKPGRQEDVMAATEPPIDAFGSRFVLAFDSTGDSIPFRACLRVGFVEHLDVVEHVGSCLSRVR